MPKSQAVIAIDQFFNTLIRDYPDGPHGWADETISSRAWRLSRDPTLAPCHAARWERRRRRIDRLFHSLVGQVDHCWQSYLSELRRRQSPPELRPDPLSLPSN